MKTPSSKYVPSGPVMAASHSKKLSSVIGPAAIPGDCFGEGRDYQLENINLPSGGFCESCLNSAISLLRADPAILY